MRFNINRTDNYHLKRLNTLGWELTVCNAMEDALSPVRRVLKNNTSFGNHLLLFLQKYIPLKNIKSVLEIGGGYGYLMRDILNKYKNIKTVMLDISEHLIEMQKNELKDYNVQFIKNDVFLLDMEFYKHFDLVILNENMGDFPAIENIIINEISPMDNEYYIKRMQYFIDRYNLKYCDNRKVNFNAGACEIIDKLCLCGVPFIYAGEHSCEVEIPDPLSGELQTNPSNNPEKIKLFGHNEYTIKFSDLQCIAVENNYESYRGRFSDIIEINNSDEINFIMRSNSQKDDHEIIRQFIEDLNKYEYLVLIRKT